MSEKREIKAEEIEALANDDECGDCGHALILHVYAGGNSECAAQDCDCVIY